MSTECLPPLHPTDRLRHDWRLIDERTREWEIHHQVGAPGYGSATAKGVVRRWYCTRCRLIEETTDESA